MPADYPQVEIESREAWWAWLQKHHASERGIWLVTWKRGPGAHVSYDDIVDEAIAFGWVDSQPRKLDDGRSQRLLTPRKPSSGWSRVNKARVERLTTEGRMTAAGIAAVEAAKANGAWNALDHAQELTEPDDLRAALNRTPGARTHWDAFPPSAKRAILEWIGNARRDETRTARVSETARLAAQNVRANQWRQPKGR